MRVVLQVLVKEDIDVMLGIVNQSEGTDGAGLQAEIFFHAPFGSQTKLPLMEQMFQIVDAHIVVALKDNQIMSVSLVITEEEVLAMSTRETAPKRAAILNSGCGGMLGVDEGDAELLETFIDLWLPNH